jgi:thymidine kinase
MNSSKTAQLIMVAHNYRSQGKHVLVLKPTIDIRTEQIYSRAINCIPVDKAIDTSSTVPIFDNEFDFEGIHCILVDECQWLSDNNVEELKYIATKKVPIICYGLKTDYKSRLFTGSKRLIEIADSIEEIKNVCIDCDKKAIINAKFYIDEEHNKKIISCGSDEPDFGAEEKYQAMCWKCWRSV